MDEHFYRKYKKVLEILPDVAGCAQEKLILVGGTALALFHLKHRISVDLDFVPLHSTEIKMKEMLKGCLTKKGYRTMAGAYKNQFVVQFEDTSIKIEIFKPDFEIKNSEPRIFGNAKLAVASMDDILELKMQSYASRKEARDLFDVFFILKQKKAGFGKIKQLLEAGMPKNVENVAATVHNEEDYLLFRKVIDNASKTSG